MLALCYLPPSVADVSDLKSGRLGDALIKTALAAKPVNQTRK